MLEHLETMLGNKGEEELSMFRGKLRGWYPREDVRTPSGNHAGEQGGGRTEHVQR